MTADERHDETGSDSSEYESSVESGDYEQDREELSGSNMADDNMSGFDSDEECDEPVHSFLKDYTSTSTKEVWNYMHTQYGLDLAHFVKMFVGANKSFTDYTRMSLVNYMRSRCVPGDLETKEQVRRVLSEMNVDSPFWNDEKYLQPVVQNDRLLWDVGVVHCDYDLVAKDTVLDSNDDEKDASFPAAPVIAEGAVKSVEEENQQLKDQVARLSTLVQELVGSDPKSRRAASGEAASSSKAAPKGQNGRRKKGDIDLSNEFEAPEDVPYFESYSYDEIHREMIMDEVRTKSYHDFIVGNPQLFKDKVVLDVGCGSGILSMFCAMAGAKLVVGLDAAASTANKARRIIAKNGFADRIQVVVGKVEEMDLFFENEGTDKVKVVMRPVGATSEASMAAEGLTPFKCDMLVSEWMGYCLLYEAMLFTVFNARDRWLNRGGMIVPNVATIGVHSADFYDVIEGDLSMLCGPMYGLDLSELKMDKTKYFADAVVTGVSNNRINSNATECGAIDLHHATIDQVKALRMPFKVDMDAQASRATSLVVYFDCIFDPVFFYCPERVGGDKALYTRSAEDLELRDMRCFRRERVAEGMEDDKKEDDKKKLAMYDEWGARIDGGSDDKEEAKELPTAPKTQYPLEVVFSTSPVERHTHWKQTVLHFKTSDDWGFTFAPGPRYGPYGAYGTLKGFVSMAPHHENPRHLAIVLELNDVRLGDPVLDDDEPLPPPTNLVCHYDLH